MQVKLIQYRLPHLVKLKLPNNAPNELFHKLAVSLTHCNHMREATERKIDEAKDKHTTLLKTKHNL